MATTFADELGKIAAVALEKREHTEQAEKEKLRAHLETEWKTLRKGATHTANEGKTSFSARIHTSGCHFTVFKPTRIHVVSSLPDELKAMYQNNNLTVGHASGSPMWPSFDIVITFATQAATSLHKLKREREAAKRQADEADDEATTKKVKVEPKVKVETE